MTTTVMSTASQPTPEGYRLFYPYAALPGTTIKAYTGTPVKVYGNDAPPAESLQWKPPETGADQAVYFDGIGWAVGLQLSKVTMEMRKAVAMSKANAKFRERVASLSVGYTTEERTTWPEQEAAALEFQKSGELNYLLRKLAQGNGTTVEIIAQKIIAKGVAYRRYYADFLSEYQRERRTIESATIPSALPQLTVRDLQARLAYVQRQF